MTEFERGPLLWLPKTKEVLLETRTPPSCFSGRYRIEIEGADGRRRVAADWFKNLITTNGGNQLGTTSPLSFCAVGSGNTAPALTDTALVSLVASTGTAISTVYGNSSSAPWYGSTTYQYSFAAGTATGNLSEVGVGASPTSLFSRALILDGGGSPTTITVLSSEALYVTYQLFQYAPTTDVTGNITIGGVSYSYTLRASLANTTNWAYQNNDYGLLSLAQVSNGTIGSVTGSISGTTSNADGISNSAYSSGSFSMAGTASWSLTQGNVSGGVTAAQFLAGVNHQSRGQFQIGFGSAIPKTSSYTLALSFSVTWTLNSP